MFRLLLLVLLSAALSACTLGGRKSLDDPSLGPNPQDAALIFQSNEKFATFLTAKEKLKVKEVEHKALNFGKPSEVFDWTLESKTSGTIVAFQLFRVGTEQCRKFKHAITNAGKSETAEATACLRSSGKWQLVR